jgi:hypothetical protein
MARLRADAQHGRRRRARRVGPVGFIGAALLPVALWHRVIADIAGEFRFDAAVPDHRLVAVGADGAPPDGLSAAWHVAIGRAVISSSAVESSG